MKYVTLMFLLVFSIFLCQPIGHAEEKPIKMVFTHWEPPSGVGASSVLDFCKELEAKTKGKVKVEAALASTLGPAAEQFELVARGVADLGGFIPLYTPGRFPLLSLMIELPHRVQSSKPITWAMNELIQKGYFDKEFEPTKPLWMSCIPPIQILLAKEKITDLKGLRGKKIRTSGEFWLALTPKLGMVPVAITVSDTYSALEKGTIDAAYMPYSTMNVFKLNEVTKYVIEVDLTYSAFAYAINKKVFDSLTRDVQESIIELSKKYAEIEAQKHDQWNEDGKKGFLAMGGGREVFGLSKADWAKIEEQINAVSEEWIKKREEKGYAATKFVREVVRPTFNKYGVK